MAWASGWPALTPGLEGSSMARAMRPELERFERLLTAGLLFEPERAHKRATPSLSQARGEFSQA